MSALKILGYGAVVNLIPYSEQLSSEQLCSKGEKGSYNLLFLEIRESVNVKKKREKKNIVEKVLEWKKIIPFTRHSRTSYANFVRNC